MRGAAGWLVIGFVGLNAAGVIAQRELPPFVVGVWVTAQPPTQGAILPYADFDGRQWHSSWPEPLDTSAGAPAPPPLRPLSRIPSSWWGISNFEPLWELIEPDGRRHSLQITRTEWAGHGSSCSANIGLRTNLSARTYEDGDALVSSRAGIVHPVTKLTPKSPEWRTMMALLPGIYQRHDKPVRRIDGDVQPDLKRGSRPTLDALFMSTDASGDYMYFESWRVRMDLPGDSAITGWLWRPSTTSGFQLIKVEVMARDQERNPRFLPLGVVSDDTRRFWLGVWTGWDNALSVLDVRRGRVKEVVHVGYGGC
jgi:hypothetical protein